MQETSDQYVYAADSAAVLELVPSQALACELGKFYAPSKRNEALARISLRSIEFLPLRLRGGGQFSYQSKRLPASQALTAYNSFKNNLAVLHQTGKRLPQLSTANVSMSTLHPAIRIRLAFAVDPHTFDDIEGFSKASATGVLAAKLDITSPYLLPNLQLLSAAVRSLRSTLGVNHPARSRVSESKRFVGDDYYVTLSEQLRRID